MQALSWLVLLTLFSTREGGESVHVGMDVAKLGVQCRQPWLPSKRGRGCIVAPHPVITSGRLHMCVQEAVWPWLGLCSMRNGRNGGFMRP
jgi:hypothetical protein